MRGGSPVAFFWRKGSSCFFKTFYGMIIRRNLKIRMFSLVAIRMIFCQIGYFSSLGLYYFISAFRNISAFLRIYIREPTFPEVLIPAATML
jgi:hypothetical protein